MKKLITIYVVIAVITFGSSWHHNADAYDPRDREAMNTLGAFLSSMLWPLYWSYRFYEPRP